VKNFSKEELEKLKRNDFLKQFSFKNEVDYFIFKGKIKNQAYTVKKLNQSEF
jgi:hypothetical protein